MIVPPSSLCRTEYLFDSNRDPLGYESVVPWKLRADFTGFLEPSSKVESSPVRFSTPGWMPTRGFMHIPGWMPLSRERMPPLGYEPSGSGYEPSIGQSVQQQQQTPNLKTPAGTENSTFTRTGRVELHRSSTADLTTDISFRTETKTVYVCTRDNCNKRYSRLQDLRRHCRGLHLHDHQFKCRALGCERAVRGFPRKDKRDTHEKKMHIDIGDGILL